MTVEFDVHVGGGEGRGEERPPFPTQKWGREGWPSPLSLLPKPTTTNEVFVHHHVPTTHQHHLHVSPGNLISPPFVVDAPDFPNLFDLPALAGEYDCDRQIVFVQLDTDGPREIQGSKSMRAYRRSGIRDHGCTSMM